LLDGSADDCFLDRFVGVNGLLDRSCVIMFLIQLTIVITTINLSYCRYWHQVATSGPGPSSSTSSLSLSRGASV